MNAVQRNVTDAWNRDQNGQDTPTRGMYYDLGPELDGTKQMVDGGWYMWACVSPKRYWVRLARVVEAVAAPGVPCMYCWSKMK